MTTITGTIDCVPSDHLILFKHEKTLLNSRGRLRVVYVVYPYMVNR